MTTITINRALLEQALDALEAAKNGLLWYQDTCPDATNDSDDEAMCKIDSALETLRAELAKPATAPDAKAMAERLMGWPLPKDFSPDCGISFDGRKDDEWNKNKTWPTGTNLLTVDQAIAMFKYVLSQEGGAT